MTWQNHNYNDVNKFNLLDVNFKAEILQIVFTL